MAAADHSTLLQFRSVSNNEHAIKESLINNS
jgi:hypothetical protein